MGDGTEIAACFFEKLQRDDRILNQVPSWEKKEWTDSKTIWPWPMRWVTVFHGRHTRGAGVADHGCPVFPGVNIEFVQWDEETVRIYLQSTEHVGDLVWTHALSCVAE